MMKVESQSPSFTPWLPSSVHALLFSSDSPPLWYNCLRKEVIPVAVKYFRMDTSAMPVEHRNELLTAISRCVGVGWWNMTEEPFIFRLRWDDEHDFLSLVPHADECTLTLWEFS
jgi:hypothetical protein